MSRSERLLQLLQVLRRHRHPVSANSLAEEVGVSIRTLYRDIASLRSQGAAIDGEAGLGYVLRPGFVLPPLMFSPREIDALVLGMRLVTAHGDHELAQDASGTLAKISAVLPAELKRELELSTLFIGAQNQAPVHAVNPELLRVAIRMGKKLTIDYADASGAMTRRIVWPYALVYFEMVRVVMCWCELRNTYRNFRTDRISGAEVMGEPYPRSKHALLKEWRRTHYVAGRSLLPETDTTYG
jgi:predicted DNA-binding transcriptional regulator YafY